MRKSCQYKIVLRVEIVEKNNCLVTGNTGGRSCEDILLSDV